MSKNECPDCGYTLWRFRSTGKYHCARCKVAFTLVKVDKRGEITAGMRLMVRRRPMIVAEMALRLGVSSKVVRRHAAKAEDLYVWDGMVRFGTGIPDFG